MEYHIDVSRVRVDTGQVTDALRSIDPAALVDLVEDTGTLRVSAALSAPELLASLAGVGLVLSRDRIQQLPSYCCGGCGG
jgi:hypothetical protein